MAKIDHAAIRTSSYEDAQKFFEDVFDMHMSISLPKTAMIIFLSPLIM